MCGIAGILQLDQTPINSVIRLKESLTAMADSMHHRGPDGGNVWCADDQKIGFAHRRLRRQGCTTNVQWSFSGAGPMRFGTFINVVS